ncbi:uncharacterized protein [Onthophagus taurus]|uniref:uncharacterized protein n=1 Tax=Onthophagus taurus TaxID=166361 RepID=UPI0039BE5D6E
MTQNRKRGRNVLEDEMEFMPLSKRINNLHINNTLLTNPPNLGNGEWPVAYGLPTPPESNNDWTSYNPELSETENPHYYNINKLLYEMYIERQQRSRNTM